MLLFTFTTLLFVCFFIISIRKPAGTALSGFLDLFCCLMFSDPLLCWARLLLWAFFWSPGICAGVLPHGYGRGLCVNYSPEPLGNRRRSCSMKDGWLEMKDERRLTWGRFSSKSDCAGPACTPACTWGFVLIRKQSFFSRICQYDGRHTPIVFSVGLQTVHAHGCETAHSISLLFFPSSPRHSFKVTLKSILMWFDSEERE